MTVNRLWNLVLLKTSYHLSIILKKPIHWGTPLAVSIEPTTACNLRCPQCPSGLRQFSRPTGNLKKNWNDTFLARLGRNLQYVNYYFQGEPFIHPDFANIVKAASERNIYVVTSTNAHFMNAATAEQILDSGLNEIIISIDGITQETYSDYRREGDLEKVITGAKALIRQRKKRKRNKLNIVFQFLVTRKNEHEIEKLHLLAEEIGVDEVRLKTVQVYDLDGNGADLVPENQKYSRYAKNLNGELKLKNEFKNQCWRMWSSCVITWDGKIVPCCFDKDASLEMGNILKDDFKRIWKNKIYSQFRSQILKTRKEIEICKNCSEGSKVWA